MRRLLPQLIWIDINDPAIFSAYSEIKWFREKQGIAMGENGAWIAATAKASNSTLLTTHHDFGHLHAHHLTQIWFDPPTGS